MASKVGAVIDALQTALETDHDNTAYTSPKVQRTLFWPEESVFPAGIDTLYMIRPGEKTGAQFQSCSVDERLETFILAAQRYKSASEDPFRANPSRVDVAADLVADVEEKLRKDPKLGATVLDVFDGVQAADYSMYIPGWVVAELRISIKYRYGKDSR